jgi:hypothetical protein
VSVGSPRFLCLCKEILERGYSLRCSTFGSSMFPLLTTGSVIQVDPVAASDLRPGDVMVYRVGEAVVAHRLVQKSWELGRLRLWARGDSFPRHARGEDITPEQVLGRVATVDWGKGLKIKIDAGWGRALGIILGTIAPLIWRAAPALCRLKERLTPLWMGRIQS